MRFLATFILFVAIVSMVLQAEGSPVAGDHVHVDGDSAENPTDLPINRSADNPGHVHVDGDSAENPTDLPINRSADNPLPPVIPWAHGSE